MQRTLIRRAFSARNDAVRGIENPWRPRTTDYPSYKSRFGPQYKVGMHFSGVNASTLAWYGSLAAGMGVSAGIFALYFFSGVPRVQKDILQKLPIIGKQFVHEVPPEDNPF
ncbi:ubiquinol cytochrome c reductase 85 kDa subunit [Teratosphaeria destructans]|uniref:Ubiquinol cytochrome c reductase 85 kDa subunit n=1 Tax=Teratosphaeria destructans TaxID=418781 RepID=A0A9W7SVJ2_9PEZI|nr:ubiquinol cytochrome c reductase 85 kDa subunit [Teratosphaeria destructans]